MFDKDQIDHMKFLFRLASIAFYFIFAFCLIVATITLLIEYCRNFMIVLGVMLAFIMVINGAYEFEKWINKKR